MPARKSASKSSPPGATTADRDEPAALSLIVIAGTMALLVARWMLPTESSVDGETLWIVQGWLALAVVWIWDSYRCRQPLLQCDAVTLGVCLLVVGHIVSGWGVFQHGGDRRAALNMMWEWVSLGVSFLIVRSYCRRANLARRMVWGLAAVAVALAGLGLYQHYVWFPQIRGEYEPLKEELESILEKGRYGTDTELRARQSRILAIQDELRKFGVPLNDTMRALWERRLYSDEPFGPFALTNTFAGLLVAFLFIAMGAFMAGLRGGWKAALGPAIALGLILWCLLLTKSRTAWVGGLCGIVCWLTLRGGAWTRRSFVWIAICVGVGAMLVVGVSVSGGLDRETISESPKSIQYRFEYWTATADVVREFPLLGPGPGNFRQHYLKYKLPGASEEIRDPHNLLLDLWCSGGITAVLGILLILAVVIRKVLQLRDAKDVPPANSPSSHDTARPWAVGVLVGILLIASVSWFYNDGGLGRHLSILAGTAIALAALAGGFRSGGLPIPAVVAATLALLVHLMGAGGIEMPAITQLFVVLTVAVVEFAAAGNSVGVTAARQRSDGSQRMQKEEFPASTVHPIAAIGGSGVAMILFGAALASSTLPVMTRNRAVAEAGFARTNQRDDKRAARYLKDAAAADPFSAGPLHQLAMLTHSRYRNQRQTPGLLTAAIDQQKLAVEQDPHHFAGYRRLGQWLAERYDRDGKPADRTASLAAFEDAVKRYPHNAQLLAEFAKTLHCAGESDRARARAKEALALDELNKSAGHRDKYLAETYRIRLQSISAGTAKFPCDNPQSRN